MVTPQSARCVPRVDVAVRSRVASVVGFERLVVLEPLHLGTPLRESASGPERARVPRRRVKALRLRDDAVRRRLKALRPSTRSHACRDVVARSRELLMRLASATRFATPMRRHRGGEPCQGEGEEGVHEPPLATSEEQPPAAGVDINSSMRRRRRGLWLKENFNAGVVTGTWMLEDISSRLRTAGRARASPRGRSNPRRSGRRPSLREDDEDVLTVPMALGEPAPRGGVALTCIVELDAAFVSIRANAINLHLGARASSVAQRVDFLRVGLASGVGGERSRIPDRHRGHCRSVGRRRRQGWSRSRGHAARLRSAHCEDLVREHAEGEDVRGRADWPWRSGGHVEGPEHHPGAVSLSGETFAAVAAAPSAGVSGSSMRECRKRADLRMCGPSPLRATLPATTRGADDPVRAEGRRAPPRPERARVARAPCRRRSARASTRVSRRARAP